MSGLLIGFARKLYDKRVIDDRSYSRICTAGRKLRSFGDSPRWEYVLPASDRLEFRQIEHAKVGKIKPTIFVTIETRELADPLESPFVRLNATAEIFGSELEARRGICRWHLDLADDSGDGPRFHLQHGGHWAGASERQHENQLDEPRHLHPPMDLILLSEVIVANFYHKEWLAVRDEESWKQFIKPSQRLCYSAFWSRMGECLEERPRPLLGAMWSDNW